MNRVSVQVDNISLVLSTYDQIKVYRADSETGSYLEITDVDTRIVMYAEYSTYFYDDSTGTSSHWYKTSYYNSSTTDESPKSDPIEGGTEVEKIGYSFGNYSAPPGSWGKVLTADDIRYTYFFGIDCIGSDIAQTAWADSQFDFYIDLATAELEEYLGIDIRKRVWKTLPAADLKRSPTWVSGVDYTDIESTYEFDPVQWMNFGFIQLRHYPVISVERADWFNPVHGKIMDLVANNWIRVNNETGQLNFYPTGGYGYGPYSISSLAFRGMSVRYPGGFEFDYTTGYPSSDYVPRDIRDIVAKFASIKALAAIGDGLMAGFSSSSVSLDGLSESFSSTQSATNAYFGARILEYAKEIKEWMERNRYRHGSFPLSFVGF
jgi:hypothetical protein